MTKRTWDGGRGVLFAAWVILACACDTTSDHKTQSHTDGGRHVKDSGDRFIEDAGSSMDSGDGTGGAVGTGGNSGTGGTGGSSGAGGTDPSDCSTCVTSVFSWGYSGGNVRYTDLSALSPCGTYTHGRMSSDPSVEPIQCQNALPCDGASVITAGDVAKAIADADVQKAIMQPILYGTDPRPSDGAVYQFRFLYNTVEVGEPCNGQAGCKEIPAGVQTFVDLLKALDTQQLATAPCDASFK
jgi:hypothetical protein